MSISRAATPVAGTPLVEAPPPPSPSLFLKPLTLPAMPRPPTMPIPTKPKEEYFVPLAKATKKITQVVGDMMEMKKNHLRIMDEIRGKYEEIETDTNEHYQTFFRNLKEKAMSLHVKDRELYLRLDRDFNDFKANAEESITMLQTESSQLRLQMDEQVVAHKEELEKLEAEKQVELDQWKQQADKLEATRGKDREIVESEFADLVKDLETKLESEQSTARKQYSMSVEERRSFGVVLSLLSIQRDIAAAETKLKGNVKFVADQAAVVELQARIAELESELRAKPSNRALKATVSIAENVESLGAYTTGSGGHEMQHEAAAEQIADLKRELSKLKGRHVTETASAQEEIVDLQRQIADLRGQLDEAQQKVADAETEKTKGLESSQATFAIEMEEKVARLQLLQSENESLQAQVAKLTTQQAETFAQRIEAITATMPKVEKIKAEFETMQAEYQPLEKELTDWQATFKAENGHDPTTAEKQAAGKVETYQKVKKLKGEAQKRQIKVQEQQLKAVDAELAKNRLEKDTLQGEIEKIKSDLETEILALQTENKKSAQLVSEAENSAATLKNTVSELRSELREAKAQAAVVTVKEVATPVVDTEQIEALEKDIAKYKAQVAKLREDNQKLNAKLIAAASRPKSASQRASTPSGDARAPTPDQGSAMGAIDDDDTPSADNEAIVELTRAEVREELEEEMNTLKSQLTEAERNLRRVTEDLASANDLLTRSTEKLQQAESENVRLKQDMDDQAHETTEQVDALRAEIRQINANKLEELISQSGGDGVNDAVVGELKRQLESVKLELSTASAQLKDSQGQATEVRRQKEQLEKEKETLEEEIRDLEAKLKRETEEREEAEQSLQEKISALELKVIESSVKTGGSSTTPARPGTKTGEGAKAATGSDAGLQAKYLASQKEIKELKDANSKNERELKKAQATVEEAKAKLTKEFEKDKAKLEKQISDMTAERDRALTRSEKIEERLKKAEDSVAKSSGASKEKMEDLSAQVSSLTKELKASKAEIEKKEKELKEASSGSEKQIKKKEEEFNNKIEALQKQLDSLQKKYDVAQKELDKLRDDLSSADHQKAELNQKITDLTDEIDALKKIAGQAERLKKDLETIGKDLLEAKVERDTFGKRLQEESTKRKDVQNELEDIKGNIRVYCRVRPLKKEGPEAAAGPCVKIADQFTIKHSSNRTGKLNETAFYMTRVFHEQASQDEVFKDSARLVQSAIDGYNVCIFAYGQTGSGKTHTMIGDLKVPQLHGIAPRAIDLLFNLQKQMTTKNVSFEVIMVELYRERFFDLLNPKPPPKKGEKEDVASKLTVMRNPADGLMFVRGAVEVQATSPEEMLELLMKGMASRRTSSTAMNSTSSRSHLVFSIRIKVVDKKDSNKRSTGKLSLIDLAGSERVSKTEASPDQIKEAAAINQSLMELGQVIHSLSQAAKGGPQLVMRSNPLVMLMQDSIGGDAKTLMFVNISPSAFNEGETLNTLLYGSRARLITNTAKVNTMDKKTAELVGKVDEYRKATDGLMELCEQNNLGTQAHQIVGGSIKEDAPIPPSKTPEPTVAEVADDKVADYDYEAENEKLLGEHVDHE